MSGAPIISGTNQLPKPPIIAGMTMKKIMIIPCAEYEHIVDAFVGKNTEGPAASSSRRIINDRKVPMQPAKIANNRYIVPMSLWFVEQNQRLKNVGEWS